MPQARPNLLSTIIIVRAKLVFCSHTDSINGKYFSSLLRIAENSCYID